MPKAAIVVLAGTETPDGLGRIVNAMEATKEFHDAGDDVELILDGAGVQWVPELEDESHDYHHLYAAVREEVSVCDYCSSAFDVDTAVDDAGLERLGEYDGHPSIRSLVADGYEIVTF